MIRKSRVVPRRQHRAIVGGVAAAVLTATLLPAVPAFAAEAQTYNGIVLSADTAGDLSLQAMRYEFEEDGVPIPPGPNAVPGATGPTNTTTWQTTTVGRPDTRMIGQIVDFGTVTDYWVVVEGSMFTEEFFSSSCHFYRGDPGAGGQFLDPDSESPYACSATPYTVDYSNGQTVTQSFSISSLNWATVRGAISPQGSIMLGDGHLESPTTRFIVDGRWYPSDPAEQGPFVTIEPGATLDWAAFRRNGESTENASGYFSYRIYDGGVPTRFWVQGMASNWRGVEFNWDYSCQIFDGNPLEGASPAAHATPYRCDMTTTKVNGNGDYRVDFNVHVVPIQTVGPLQARPLMSEGCGDAGDACYFVPATNEAWVVNGEPLGPRSQNPTDERAKYEFSYASGRSITNSVDVSVSAEANVLDIFVATIKVAYGWQETNETEKKWVASMFIPPHHEGWFEFTPAYRKITGDFLFEVGGTWYRVENSTFIVPDSTSPGTLVSHTSLIAGNPGGGVGAEPPVTPAPVDPALANLKPGTTRGTASGSLATTGGTADPAAFAWIAGGLLLAGAGAVTVRRLGRRRPRPAAR